MSKRSLSLILIIICLSLPACSSARKAKVETTLPAEQPISGEEFDKNDPLQLSLTYPAKSQEQPDELKSLLKLTQPRKVEQTETAVAQMRPQAITEAGQLISVQTAIAWRYANIMKETEKYAATLDQTFNFGPLMLISGDAIIMPPVLSRGDASMRIEQADAATSAVTTFELLNDAKFVAVVPNWRTYLHADSFPAPEQPHPTLLPKTAEEKKVWRDAVLQGWAIGVEQADQLYQDNVARLTRDYKGIMLYHMLATEQLLLKPELANADLGTRIANRKMNIDQKVFRITRPAIFNGNEKQWKPLTKLK